jgi:hypothetical protein
MGKGRGERRLHAVAELTRVAVAAADGSSSRLLVLLSFLFDVGEEERGEKERRKSARASEFWPKLSAGTRNRRARAPRGILLISHRWVCPDIVLFSYICFIKKRVCSHKKRLRLLKPFLLFPFSDISVVGAFSSSVSLLSFVLNYAM